MKMRLCVGGEVVVSRPSGPMVDGMAGRLARVVAAASGLALGAGVALADEDWMKLNDRLPPVQAQVWTAEGSARTTPPFFPAENLWLASWIPLNAFPGNQGSGNDCWGYVSPSGRKYAIMGLQKGFGVVEVTNPRNAQLVGYISGATSLWHDVKVLGPFAYGVSEGGLGIQVIDLREVDNGVVSLVRNQQTQGHSTTHNIIVNEASGYLYLAGANVGNGGLVAVSTSNPTRPSIVGAWTTHYVHDVQVVTYTSGPYAGREIAFCFNGQYGLEVVDVTNKSSMTRIAARTYPFVSYCHQGWLSEDRRFLYVDDELDEGIKVNQTTTRVFNVENPGNPIYLGTFSGGTAAIDHNQYAHNGKLYQANYRAGLQVFDLADPNDPQLIGSFDTFPGSNEAFFNGAWSTYPYFGEDTILISDIERGLFVVEYDDRKLLMSGVETPAVIRPERQAVAGVRIESEGAEVVSTSVTLHARINGGEEILAPATDNGDGTFSAMLPEAPCHSDITYFFSAQSDTDRTFYFPRYGPNEPLKVYVAEEVVTVFEDLMTGNDFNGWSVGDPSDPDTALLGKWIKMQPQETPCQPSTGFTGTECWVTDGRAGSQIGDYDVEGGKTTLITPMFDLTGYTDPRISYWRWFCNGAGQEVQNEVFRVDISADGGATWTNMETLQNGPGTRGGWNFAEHRVTQIITPTSMMKVRFVANDTPPITTIIEAAIDDFRVLEGDCTTCAADFNDDGSADVVDLLDFLDDFSNCAGQPAPCGQIGNADVNGDGSVDVIDLLEFLDVFSQGC